MMSQGSLICLVYVCSEDFSQMSFTGFGLVRVGCDVGDSSVLQLCPKCLIMIPICEDLTLTNQKSLGIEEYS